MEHEVLVPLSPQALRRSLDRPELLAACLPGFTPDEGGGQDGGEGPDLPLTGRLKLRVGGSSITFRGELRRLDGGPAECVFALDGEQSVGTGSVAGTVRLRLVAAADDSTLVTFLTSLQAKGRVEELSPRALEAAARRLLDRFCVDLATRAEFPAEPSTEEVAEPSADQELDAYLGADLDEVEPFGALEDLGEIAELAELGELRDLRDLEALGALEEAGVGDPTRRSIVGRSAEEVDHAPPRGRYAPTLPTRSARSRASARWGGPERRMGEPPVAEGERPFAPWLLGGGVALLGGAVILVRALRRSR